MNRPAPPRPRSLELFTGGILLFLLLSGALWSFASAAGQTLLLPILLAGCALLTVLLTLLCALPTRWMLAGMAALLAALLLLVWRLFPWLRLGEITYRCAVVNTVCTSLELDGFIRPIAQLPDAVWVRCATLLTLVAAGALGTPLALAVVRRPSLPAAFLLTGPFVLAPLCISVTPDWMPLMGLLLGWIALGLGALVRRWDRAGAARLTLLSLPAAALLLALLGLAMPQDSYQRPRWADDALDAINTWVSRLDPSLAHGKGLFGLGSGGSFTDADGRIALADAGPLRFSGRTVLEVDTELRGRIYLRGFSSAVYEDGSWNPLPEDLYSWMFWDETQEGDPPSFTDSVFYPSLEGFQPLNFPALADRETFPHKNYARVTVRNVGADPDYVYVPYHILSRPDELSGTKFVNDAWLARGDGVRTHTVYVQPGCDPLSGAELPGEASQAEGTYTKFVYESSYMAVYEDVVDALDAVIEDLATDMPGHLPGGTENPAYQAYLELFQRGNVQETDVTRAYPMIMANIVAAYLDGLAEYNPDTPATPEGEDFVSYFLTESHEGYCMHFASAATLILRYMGIPARYVTGYVADVPASGHVNVPDSAAHAWVEVYIDGYGWEPVEVTPAYAGSSPGQSGTVEPTPTPTAAPTPAATQAPQASARPSAPHDEPENERDEAAPLDLRVILIPLAVLLAALAFPIRRFLGRARRERNFRQADTNQAVIAAYLHLKKLARWGGDIPAFVFALAKKAQFSPHTLTEEERLAAVEAARTGSALADKALPWYKRFLCRYILGLC